MIAGITKPFKYADLFCGAGGLALGFQRAGFDCAFAMDGNKAAVATHCTNFDHPISCGLITEQTQLPPVDVIIGGPPCQGFSSAGLRREADPRSMLVGVFAKLVVIHKPRAFVFENVEGFLTAGNGERVLELLCPLVEAGYRIHLRKINAANYGVPQHRKRVIGIGCLGFDPAFPEATHGAYGAPGAARLYGHLQPTPTIAEALGGLGNPAEAFPGEPDDHYSRPLSSADKERIHLLRQGQTMKDLPEALWHRTYHARAFRRVMDGTPSERRGGAPTGLRRLYADHPCKAITSGAISEFVHPIEDRFLTIRECSRIQTFPDSFKFCGTASERILQIGNAVPPLLAEAIANSLHADLVTKESNTNATGRLLSFIPTVSEGCSPVLERVIARVHAFFSEEKVAKAEQLELWR